MEADFASEDNGEAVENGTEGHELNQQQQKEEVETEERDENGMAYEHAEDGLGSDHSASDGNGKGKQKEDGEQGEVKVEVEVEEWCYKSFKFQRNVGTEEKPKYWLSYSYQPWGGKEIISFSFFGVPRGYNWVISGMMLHRRNYMFEAAKLINLVFNVYYLINFELVQFLED